jgi:hypothetical protein
MNRGKRHWGKYEKNRAKILGVLGMQMLLLKQGTIIKVCWLDGYYMGRFIFA